MNPEIWNRETREWTRMGRNLRARTRLGTLRIRVDSVIRGHRFSSDRSSLIGGVAHESHESPQIDPGCFPFPFACIGVHSRFQLRIPFVTRGFGALKLHCSKRFRRVKGGHENFLKGVRFDWDSHTADRAVCLAPGFSRFVTFSG